MAWETWTLRIPKPLPMGDVVISEEEDSKGFRRKAVELAKGISWNCFKVLATEELQEERVWNAKLEEQLDRTGNAEEACQVSTSFNTWVRAAELKAITMKGVGRETKEGKAMVGREQPTFVRKPIMPVRRCEDQADIFVPIGYGRATRLVATVTALLRKGCLAKGSAETPHLFPDTQTAG